MGKGGKKGGKGGRKKQQSGWSKRHSREEQERENNKEEEEHVDVSAPSEHGDDRSARRVDLGRDRSANRVDTDEGRNTADGALDTADKNGDQGADDLKGGRAFPSRNLGTKGIHPDSKDDISTKKGTKKNSKECGNEEEEGGDGENEALTAADAVTELLPKASSSYSSLEEGKEKKDESRYASRRKISDHSSRELLRVNSDLEVGHGSVDDESASLHVDFRSDPSVNEIPGRRVILSDEDSENEPEYRSCFDRWCGALSEGSQRTFVFALCNTAFGSGILAVPWVFSVFGIPFATLVFFSSACFSIISLQLLANSAITTRVTDFKGVISKTLGAPTATTIRIIIFVYCFGSVSSYFIFLFQFYGEMMKPVITLNKYSFLPIMAVFLMAPSALNLAHFRYLNLIAVACTPVVVLSVISSFLTSGTHFPQWYRPGEGLSFTSFPKACAISFYAFSCQVNLFAAYNNYSNPNPRRVNKVLLRTVVIQLTVYWIVGTCGALAFGTPCDLVRPDDHGILPRCTPDNILASPFFNGTVSIVARIAMGFSLMISVPINVFAAREQLMPASQTDIFRTLDRRPLMAFTVIFLLAAMSPGLTTVGLKDILAVVGGGGAVTFMFTMPVFITMKLRRMRLFPRHARNLILGTYYGYSERGTLFAVLILLIPIIIGYLAAIITVLQLFISIGDGNNNNGLNIDLRDGGGVFNFLTSPEWGETGGMEHNAVPPKIIETSTWAHSNTTYAYHVGGTNTSTLTAF